MHPEVVLIHQHHVEDPMRALKEQPEALHHFFQNNFDIRVLI